MAKILVAEDHDDLLRMICLVLEGNGHEVVPAHDGIEAMRLVGDGLRPDVFVSDFRMPGTTGLDAVLEIRRLQPDIPCLIVTGDESLWRSAESLALIDVEVVRKPFQVSKLLSAVSRALSAEADISGRPVARRRPASPAGPAAD